MIMSKEGKMMNENKLIFPNAEKAKDLIDSERDPVVRSLMLLVYGELLSSFISGKLPDGGVDLLYCFEALRAAFRRKDALSNALKGNYGELSADVEWTWT
jgi:hypothetical protein